MVNEAIDAEISDELEQEVLEWNLDLISGGTSSQMSNSSPKPSSASSSLDEASKSQVLTCHLEALRRTILTSRHQIAKLEEEIKKLKELESADCVVQCPSCLFLHKKRACQYFPKHVRAYPARSCLELNFSSKEELFKFMNAIQLEKDENGIPVFPTTPQDPPKGLSEARSTISRNLEKISLSLTPVTQSLESPQIAEDKDTQITTPKSRYSFETPQKTGESRKRELMIGRLHSRKRKRSNSHDRRNGRMPDDKILNGRRR